MESPRGSEFGGSQVAIRANEAQRTKQAAYDRVIAKVSEAVKQLIENNGLIPRYALRLSESGQMTPDNQLPLAEVKRRAILRNVRVKAVVKFNGKVVTSTDYYPLRLATLSVDFNRCFEFRVLHQPTDVVVDIYTSKVQTWDPLDTFIASVAVPFPAQATPATNGSGSGVRGGGSGSGGASAIAAAGGSGDSSRHQHVTHSYIPTAGWYSFTSELQGNPSDAANASRRSEVSRFTLRICITVINFLNAPLLSFRRVRFCAQPSMTCVRWTAAVWALTAYAPMTWRWCPWLSSRCSR